MVTYTAGYDASTTFLQSMYVNVTWRHMTLSKVHNPVWTIAVDGVTADLYQQCQCFYFSRTRRLMQHDLVYLDLRFQIRGATFHHSPSPKPIPTDSTRLQMITIYFWRNTTHGRPLPIVPMFLFQQDAASNSKAFPWLQACHEQSLIDYRLLPVMTKSGMPVTW